MRLIPITRVARTAHALSHINMMETKSTLVKEDHLQHSSLDVDATIAIVQFDVSKKRSKTLSPSARSRLEIVDTDALMWCSSHNVFAICFAKLHYCCRKDTGATSQQGSCPSSSLWRVCGLNDVCPLHPLFPRRFEGYTVARPG